MPRTSLACVLALLVAVPAVAGPKQEAKAKFKRALEANKEGRLDDALVDLEAAYKLDHRPDYLYAMGQIFVKLGKCDEATDAYQRFLAGTKKNTDGASLVKQALAACTPKAAEPPPPPAAEPPPPPPPPAAEPLPPPAPPPPPTPVAHAEPPPPPPPPTPVEHRSAWYSDKLGDALVLGGVAAAVAGVVVYRSAASDLDAAEAAPSLARYHELYDSAHTDQTYAIVLAAGGGALVVAGVIHYMLHDRGTETRGVAVVPAGEGAIVTWGGSL